MRKTTLRTALIVALAALCATAPLARGAATSAKTQRPATAKAVPGPVAAGLIAPGPIFDASGMGGTVVLNKDWRVGVTADPAAAQPDFDDSHWAVRDTTQSMENLPDKAEDAADAEDAAGQGKDKGGVHVQVGFPTDRHHRFAWFRLHIRLAPDHGPVALLIELPVSRSTSLAAGAPEPAVNVYANGQHIVPGGPHGANAEHYQDISRIYDLNVPSGQTDLTLAVRTLNIPFGYGAYTSFFDQRTMRLGDPTDLDRYMTLWTNRNLFERLPRLVYSVLLVVLAGFLLALYFAQKGHNEYLWLALHELAMAPVGFVELAGSSGHLDSLWFAALVMQLTLIAGYLFFEFLISFLSLGRRWYIQWLRFTAPILGGVGPTLLMVGHSAMVGVVLVLVFLGTLIWLLGWLVFMFATLIAATVRRNFEAGLLLVPLVMSIIGSIEPAMTAGMGEMMGKPYKSPLTVMAGPIPIHLANFADFVGVLVIVIIIFGRFLRIQQEQQHASSELAAARSVQELMIPQEKVATPGFEVVSVYNPADEVGGDFFHVQTMGDGGVLIVIGDVAGKGLKAAMNVSMIMGALRRTADRSPAHILEALNRVLVGSESFTTCQAAWFAAGGELVLANAGHLPPYLNSQEIAVPGGLPLGVVPEVTYEEIRLYVHPGDRILFLSDGVVEARRPSGEIFGFDRVHSLATQSAGYIADAAKTFGQSDDITVLTVRRLTQKEPAEHAVATVGTLSTAAAG